MIGVDGKKILPVYGDMRPVEVRRNNVRIAGWVEETKSGESVDFEGTYNDTADLVISGNSIQDGEPTPDAPIPVVSVEDCNLVSRTLNIVNNGNFAKGIEGWLFYLAIGSVSENICSVISTSNGGRIYKSLPIVCEAGVRVYIKALVKVTNDVCTRIQINTRGTIIGGTYQVVWHLINPIRDSLYFASGIITIPSNASGNLRFDIINNYVDDEIAKDKVMEVREVIATEISALPVEIQALSDIEIKEWCDEHFARWQDKKSHSIPIPPLRKIGDVADTYNPKTGEYVQRIGVKVFDGTETVAFNNYPNRKDIFYTSVSNMWYVAGTQTPSMCSHFKYVTSTGTHPTGGHLLGKYAKVMHIMTPNNYETTADFKSWLAAQYAAGAPVTVYYPLAEPVVTYLDPAPVPTYYPYTRIEQDGAVKGVIDATAKVIE